MLEEAPMLGVRLTVINLGAPPLGALLFLLLGWDRTPGAPPSARSCFCA
jgi:hypothetical protein